MPYHFYFKNSEPVYETEYMQSLKQFAVQEVFPAYVLNENSALLLITTITDNTLTVPFLHISGNVMA